MKRVALVGAGNRAKNYNLPIIKSMLDKIKIVGITTKSGNVSEEFNFLEAKAFDSITRMVAETTPDVIVVTIKSNIVSSVLEELISVNVPFLLETTDNFSVYETIKSRAQVSVGILEQWPFLPMERFKKQLLNSGAIGDIIAVENNFRTYDYHGAAQIRNYLPNKFRMVSLKGFENYFETERYSDKEGSLKPKSEERMRVKVGVFENGTLLIYKFSDKHKNMPFRGHNTLNVYGSKGSIISDCLLDGYCNINVLDSDGKTHSINVEKQFQKETIESISCDLPAGEKISWRNKYIGLSEHQIATAYLLEEMLVNNNFIYTVDDAIQDMAIAYSQ